MPRMCPPSAAKSARRMVNSMGATIAGVSVALFFVVLVVVELRRWQQVRGAQGAGAATG